MAEQYYNISPYAFCAGNPMRYVDPDGKDIIKFDNFGRLLSYRERKGKDVVKIMSINPSTQSMTISAKKKFSDGTISKPSVDNKTLIFDSKNESYNIFEFLVLNTNVNS